MGLCVLVLFRLGCNIILVDVCGQVDGVYVYSARALAYVM